MNKPDDWVPYLCAALAVAVLVAVRGYVYVRERRAQQASAARLMAALQVAAEDRPPGVYRGDGFTVERRPDGSNAVSYEPSKR